MALLTPDWNDTTLPEGKGPEGYGSSELDVKYFTASLDSLVLTDKKPVVVYFYTPDDKKEMARIQEAIFKVENVGASLRAFKLYKLDVSRIQREDLKKLYARNTPKFHFIDRKGQVVAKVENPTTVSFLAAVKKAFAASYESSYEEYLKAHRGILDRLDAANSKKSLVQGKREQLKTRPRNSKTIEMEKELDRDAEAIRADEAKIAADQEKLFKGLRIRRDLVSKS